MVPNIYRQYIFNQEECTENQYKQIKNAIIYIF